MKEAKAKLFSESSDGGALLIDNDIDRSVTTSVFEYDSGRRIDSVTDLPDKSRLIIFDDGSTFNYYPGSGEVLVTDVRTGITRNIELSTGEVKTEYGPGVRGHT